MERWRRGRFPDSRGLLTGLFSGLLMVTLLGAASMGCSRSSAPETPAVGAAALEPPVADVTVGAFVKAGGDREKARSVGAEANPATRPSPQFDLALDQVLTQYYVIRKQLAADKGEGVKEAATQLVPAIEKVRNVDPSPATSLDEAKKIDAKIGEMLEAARALSGAADLEAERVALGRLTGPLLYLVAFHYHGDIEHQPFVYYCPMKQLAWLQDVKAIGNPYFGSSMLTCGERLPRK